MSQERVVNPNKIDELESKIAELNSKLTKYISSERTYNTVGQSISANSSYTAPADGLYFVDISSPASGYAGCLYFDSSRTCIIASCGSGQSMTIPLYIKQGTNIYTRDSGSYLVRGYLS